MSFNGWSWRAVARPIGVLSIGAVVAAGLVTTPAAAKPPTPPKSAKTAVEASRLAAQFNTSVEVEERTTEYTRTFATPQGTMQAEISNQPVRVRKDQSWVAIDTTLETRSDGLVAPKASTTDVAFSNGGNGPLARLKQDGAVFELKSPWPLSKPTLSGSKATYAAVLPGVDLVINATAESFSYNLVVQTREAASNPALRTLTFPVTIQNLELRTTQPGRPAYVDSSGRQVLTIGEALMWDSAGSKAKSKTNTAAAVDEGPSGEAKHALMEFGGSEAGLTVKPDQNMLAASNTVFPVVLDPTIIKDRAKVGWTAAWELYPGTSFWQTEHSLGVGYEGFEQSKIVRSYYQFNTSYYTNKKIIQASMSAYETHSANCTKKDVILSRVKPISPRTTWNNQPAVEADVDTVTDAKGWSSACPAGNLEFDVTASMQATSNANLTSTSFRLRASNESDKIAWKQFSSTSVLHVEYVAYPLPGYDLGAATPSDFPDACSPSSTPTVVASTRPQISGRGKVGVGDTTARVKLEFLILDQSQTLQMHLLGQLVSPGVLQTVSASSVLNEGALYTYKARTLYPIPGGTLTSAWSGPCYFRVDTKAPPPPTITASYKNVALPDCTPDPDNCTSSIPFGEKVTYTISSTSTDVVALSYVFNGNLTRVNSKSATFDLLTPNALEMKLSASSHDAAAHQSSPKQHEINVGPGLPPVAAWNLDDQSGGTAADAIGNQHPLTVTDAQFESKGRVNGSMLSNGVNSRATTPATFVDTSKNFSISAWARLTGTTDSGVVTITGQAAHGGQLRYAANINRWTFIQTVSDAPAQAQARVNSLAPPVMNAWTHLLGVYDATAKTMSLYVNGRPQGTPVTFTHTPWKATGRVEVGSVRSDPNMGPGIFPGSIDEVKIFQRGVSTVEAVQLANPRMGAPGHDEQVASRAATYPFNSVETSPDGSVKTKDTIYDSDLTVTGFAGSAIVEDVDRGNVLATSGTASESVSINRPLVEASGSFSVSAWVKITDPSKKQIIVRQAGTNKDSWRLEYRPAASGTAAWVFSRAGSDVASDKPVEVEQTTTQADASDFWTAVAVTYDAVHDEITLMVNAQAGTSIAKFTSPFSTGTTQVGKPPADATYSPSAALIDELRVYTGALSEHRACVEAFEDELSCPE